MVRRSQPLRRDSQIDNALSISNNETSIALASEGQFRSRLCIVRDRTGSILDVELAFPDRLSIIRDNRRGVRLNEVRLLQLLSVEVREDSVGKYVSASTKRTGGEAFGEDNVIAVRAEKVPHFDEEAWVAERRTTTRRRTRKTK